MAKTVALPAGQTREEVAKWKPYGIGVDVHSRFAYCTILVPNYAKGTLSRHEQTFDVSLPGIAAMRAWWLAVLAEHGIPDDRPLYSIESTATYHCPIVALSGGRPIVLNPHLARASLKKTDRFDSGVLAYHSLTGLYEPSWIAAGEFLNLRILLRTRDSLQRSLSACYSRVALRLTQQGLPIRSIDIPVHSALFRPILEDLAHGRIQVADVPDPFGTVLRAAPIAPACWDAVRASLDLAEHIETAVSRIRDGTAACLSRLRWPTRDGELSGTELHRLLRTIPGIGDVGAAVFLSEVGDPRRFRSSDCLAAYAGFDPSRRISAGKVVGVAIRPGNSRLRRALVQCANLLINQGNESYLARWARRLADRSCRSVAVIGLARRLAKVCFNVTRTGRPYLEERLARPEDRERVALGDVFPRRIANVLKKGGFTWLDEIRDLPLIEIPGIGLETAKLIQSILAGYFSAASSSDGGNAK